MFLARNKLQSFGPNYIFQKPTWIGTQQCQRGHTDVPWLCACVYMCAGWTITSDVGVLVIKCCPLASVISVWCKLKSWLHSLPISCLCSTAVLSKEKKKTPSYIMTAPHQASMAHSQHYKSKRMCEFMGICPLIWYLLISDTVWYLLISVIL